MKNLIQRTITGVLFVAVLVGCILYGPLSFGVLFAVVAALAVREFSTLVNREADIQVSPLLTMLGGSYLFFAFMGYSLRVFDFAIFIPYLLLLVYALVRELYLKQTRPLNNWAYTMMSQLYVAFPFALLNILAYQNDAVESSMTYNPVLPLAVFLFIWLNDTGAYCVGSLCGKHRLFLRISPKKSWEGSIGGALFAVIGSLVVARYNPFLSLPAWIGFAVVVVVFGTWGDLVESLLKRQLGIKDSGNVLPGHGGWLDRFDSALLAIPAVVIYLYTLLLF